MEKINTDVIIEDKVYTVISSDQDTAYVQKLAAYVNDKLESMHRRHEYSKQPYGIRQTMLLMNIADDYMRMKQQAEEARKRYEEQEAEFYNMKRELVSMQMELDSIRKKEEERADSKEDLAQLCPYLKAQSENRYQYRNKRK